MVMNGLVAAAATTHDIEQGIPGPAAPPANQTAGQCDCCNITLIVLEVFSGIVALGTFAAVILGSGDVIIVAVGGVLFIQAIATLALAVFAQYNLSQGTVIEQHQVANAQQSQLNQQQAQEIARLNNLLQEAGVNLEAEKAETQEQKRLLEEANTNLEAEKQQTQQQAQQLIEAEKNLEAEKAETQEQKRLLEEANTNLELEKQQTQQQMKLLEEEKQISSQIRQQLEDLSTAETKLTTDLGSVAQLVKVLGQFQNREELRLKEEEEHLKREKELQSQEEARVLREEKVTQKLEALVRTGSRINVEEEEKKEG